MLNKNAQFFKRLIQKSGAYVKSVEVIRQHKVLVYLRGLFRSSRYKGLRILMAPLTSWLWIYRTF